MKKWFSNLTSNPNLTAVNFIGFRDPLNILKWQYINKKAEEDQKKFKSNLNEITSGNPQQRKISNRYNNKY